MVMDYEIKCAAAVSGSDIDHTMIVLPMEDQGNKYVNNVDESSQLTTWRDFLLENGCDIDSLPRNNAGNHMITGTFVISLIMNIYGHFFHTICNRNFIISTQYMNWFAHS